MTQSILCALNIHLSTINIIVFDKIFVYDKDCRVVTVFGGGICEADQVGTFSNSAAMLIKNNGEQVLIADYDTNLITVFGINEYGKQVKHLDTLTL